MFKTEWMNDLSIIFKESDAAVKGGCGYGSPGRDKCKYHTDGDNLWKLQTDIHCGTNFCSEGFETTVCWQEADQMVNKVRTQLDEAFFLNDLLFGTTVIAKIIRTFIYSA